jgi:hypothetical protein
MLEKLEKVGFFSPSQKWAEKKRSRQLGFLCRIGALGLGFF